MIKWDKARSFHNLSETRSQFYPKNLKHPPFLLKSECYFFTKANNCFLRSSPKPNQSPNSFTGSFKHFHGCPWCVLFFFDANNKPKLSNYRGSLTGGHRKTKNEIQIPSSLNCIMILHINASQPIGGKLRKRFNSPIYLENYFN